LDIMEFQQDEWIGTSLSRQISKGLMFASLCLLISCGGEGGGGGSAPVPVSNTTDTPANATDKSASATTGTSTDSVTDTTEILTDSTNTAVVSTNTAVVSTNTAVVNTTSNAVNETSHEDGQENPVESTPVVIDLLVVYNRAANEIYDGSAQTRINHLIEVSNQIYLDSEVNLELRAVYMGEIDYEEKYDSSTAIDHITFKSHPAFSEIDSLRAEHGADMVVFMRPYADDGSCGIAWIGGYGTEGDFSSPDEKDYAYTHIAIDCNTYVLAHELGHNMGLNHSRLQDGTGGTFEYALGHGETGDFVTMMASSSAFGASKIKLFSNPDLTCNGSPCGIDREDTTSGANAVLTLNQVSRQIAAYY